VSNETESEFGDNWETMLAQPRNAPWEQAKTTVIMRNLPINYSRSMLLELIDKEGFANLFDFVYFPIDFCSMAGLGYAFINFTSHGAAARFHQHFRGFCKWSLPCGKVCSVEYGKTHQGLVSQIERYRNSAVMHHDVPDEHKPMMFLYGQRVPFPPATREIRPPIMHNTLRAWKCC